MRMNRELPSPSPQEKHPRESRRGSRFDVKFDKLNQETLPINPIANHHTYSSPTANISSIRHLTSINSEVKEVRITTTQPCKESSAEKVHLQNPELSSNTSNCCFCPLSCVHWNVTSRHFPQPVVDDYLNGPQGIAATFMKLKMGSAMFLITAFLGIEFLMPITFSRELLISGAFGSFPVHYALLINAILGLGDALLVLSLACKGLLIDKVKHICFCTLVVPLFGLLCLFYTLGGCIMFADQLEERMLIELYTAAESSTVWSGSQKFFGCCGVVSRNDWLWNHPFDKADFVFPSSCCKLTKSKICSYKLVSSSQNGCFDSEMDFLLGLSYSLMLLASLHFIFGLFGWMQLAKLYFRHKFRRKNLQFWADGSRFFYDSPDRPEIILSAKSDSTKTKVTKTQRPSGRFGNHSESYLIQSRKFNLIEETTIIKSSSTAT